MKQKSPRRRAGHPKQPGLAKLVPIRIESEAEYELIIKTLSISERGKLLVAASQKLGRAEP